jgi:ATP-dependent helicase HrpB
MPLLPIDAALPALLETLSRARTAVVQAPPGAGKSTRIPLALRDAAWLNERKIVMLEPRRLAARSVAFWMARLLGEEVGQTVGYRMRLESRVSRATRIEVVTEGVLTRMLQHDPALEDAACVIFDEYHERSLHADLGLALCLDAQTQLREDLRIVVMSATLDAEPIAAWLGGAPIVTAEGRSFPVQTRYVARPGEARIEVAVADVIRRALREEAGDVLVFLPGAGEIRKVKQLLDAQPSAGVDVLPLFGDLPQSDQERAIMPAAPGRRKVVLATTIAETSLTIEGVRIVIDSGLARRARFDPRSGMTRLITTRVSRAAADQRRGRAGRLAPGVCYRLWSEDAGRSLDPYSPPEILEADLCPLALELARWGVRNPSELRWLAPPPAAAYSQARELLQSLGALDAEALITAHGRAMSELGTHPRLAHMLLRARDRGWTGLACDLAALLGERDVLRWPPHARDADMRLRVEALRGVRDHLPAAADIDRGVRERARKLAEGWRRQLGIRRNEEDQASIDYDTGALLALAYPDRIGRRRRDQAGRFQLSNGRGAVLAESDALARAEFIAIADLDAGEREARVYLAAPIALAQITSAFAGQLRTIDTVAWDTRSEAVVARREQCLGSLTVAESALDSVDPRLANDAMLDGIRAMGIGALPWSDATRAWQARAMFMHRHQTESWPDVSDRQLLATVDTWLAPFLSGITRREHLARLDLRAALRTLLTWQQQRDLDEQAPTHITVPSGSRIALDYTPEEAPVLAARLQELFGMHATPRLAGGRAAVMVHLLSPAGRPVQVTRDLASFWATGYQEVRKELKGRYPKHYWPEDPLTAVATRKVRPTPK